MSHNKPVPPALAEFAIGERAELLANIARYETTADNCEVLRARLAKYEDAEGRPVVAVDASVELAALSRFVETVRECYQLASSYSGTLDGVDEHGGDDHEDPICAVFHRLYYAMFDGEKGLEQARSEIASRERLLNAVRASIKDSEVFCLPDSVVAALSAPSHGEQVREVVNQCAETCERAKLCSTCAGGLEFPGLPDPGSIAEARIPHHTSDGRQMLWTEVEVIAHKIIQGAIYSWVKDPGNDGGFYAPMMLSFRAAAPSAGSQQGGNV